MMYSQWLSAVDITMRQKYIITPTIDPRRGSFGPSEFYQFERH